MEISESYSIVYFNFYRGVGNQLVPKEVAITNSKLHTIKSWVFKPPTKWFELEKRQQRLNACLRRRGIYIRWEAGVTPFEEMESILRKETQCSDHVISVGMTRSEFLADLLNRDVFDMEEFFPVKEINKSTESKHCVFHKDSPGKNKCALMIGLACTDAVNNLIETFKKESSEPRGILKKGSETEEAVKNIPEFDSDVEMTENYITSHWTMVKS